VWNTAGKSLPLGQKMAASRGNLEGDLLDEAISRMLSARTKVDAERFAAEPEFLYEFARRSSENRWPLSSFVQTRLGEAKFFGGCIWGYSDWRILQVTVTKWVFCRY
jgi:hypothetical protein